MQANYARAQPASSVGSHTQGHYLPAPVAPTACAFPQEPQQRLLATFSHPSASCPDLVLPHVALSGVPPVSREL